MIFRIPILKNSKIEIKIKKSRNYKIWVSIVLLAVLIGLVFSFYFFKSPSYSFAKLLPAETVFFSQINLTSPRLNFWTFDLISNDWWEKWLVSDFGKENYKKFKEKINLTLGKSALDWERDFFPLIDNQASLSYVSRGNNAAPVIIVPVKDKDTVEYLFKKSGKLQEIKYQEKTIKSLTLFYPFESGQDQIRNLNYYFDKKNLLILSPEIEVVKKIIDVQSGYQPGLQAIGKMKNDFLTEQNFVTVYSDLDYLMENLSRTDDALNQGLNYYLNQHLSLPSPWLALNFKIDNQGLVWELQELSSAEIGQEKELKLPYQQLDLIDKNSSFLKYIFQEPIFLSLNIDWLPAIEKIKENTNFVQYFNELERRYHFDFEKDILPLLNKNNLLAVFSSEDRVDLFQTLFDCFSFNSSANCLGIVEYDQSSDQEKIKTLEAIIKQILANQFPIERDLILPDQTKIRELVADPNIFSFQTKEVEGVIYHFISQTQIGLGFAYTIMDGKLIYSNQLSTLAQAVYSKQFFNEDLAKKFILSQSQSIYLKLKKIWLGLGADILIVDFYPDRFYFKGYLR